MKSVVLRAVNANGEPTSVELSTSAGGSTEKVFKFNEKNNFQCSVPVEMTYMDKIHGERVSRANYAQFLLDVYNDEKHGFHLELVKEEVIPTVVEKPRKEKKEKKHEEVAG